MSFDCAIIGAGPAGCAAALYLSRAGRTVVLLDRASFPRRKTCGEGIMPEGVEVLRELGLYEDAAALGRVFRGVAWTTRDGRHARCRFPGGEGLGAPREELDHLLLKRAAAAPGVRVLERSAASGVERTAEGVRVCLDAGELFARRLIAADGASSPSLLALGVPRRGPARPRFGLAARLKGVGTGDLVEVFLFDGGELYLTPLPGEGRVSAALLLERRALAPGPGGREEAFWRLLLAHPALRARLARATLDTPVAGLGPLATAPSRCEDGPWLAAGDAAGAVDPLVGDGIGLALRTGRLAAEETDAALRGDVRPGRYTRRRRKLLRPKRRLARLALGLSRRPLLARAALAALRAYPPAFSALLRG
ncbi:MAG: FAD-dependent oxidoreductase [Elusimicrobiota bacterium]|nr:FAD-dependent oxidoreductase [Elusimicrobiota bacterium]